MKVIGHRGAAGLAPENSIRAIKAGLRAGVDGIEFDVRLSKDGQLFLCHDPTLERTHNVDEHISNLTAAQLLKIKSQDGDHVPTLKEALKVCGQTPVYIEAKGRGWAKALTAALVKHPRREFLNVIAFDHQELFEFTELCPDIPVYVLEHKNAFDAINAARVYGFSGIDVNFWTMNPLVYYLAKRHDLGIIVYTSNKTWIASLLKKLYPTISITTNVPNRMQHLRDSYKPLQKTVN
jgi:glycerophosphoryl diester phosphodiesterase